MIAFTFPTTGLANHWNVALIGLLFFGMQIYLCLRFWFRMKRHQRELTKLQDDLAEGGEGRDIEPFASDIPWLRWVDTNFPHDSTTPGSYTRDDVLKELDTQIASDSHYLLLQRAGVMAPLLGVIITVLGFIVLDVPETEEQTLNDILYTVTPLVAGVGTGAVLAFINQWLLHLAGGKVEAVRNAARAWFDAAIWSQVGLDAQAATVKAVTAMERMAVSVNRAAEQQEENVQTLQGSLATIRETADQFQVTYRAFGDQLGDLPGRLAEVASAAAASVQAIDALLPVGQRAVAGLDVSVSAFRTAVEGQFVEAAKTHHSSIDELAESVARINESTAQLKVSSGDLQDTVNAHTNAFKNLNRSLQKQVLPAHEGFLAALSQFNGRAEGLLERMDGLHDQVVASIEKIASLAPELNEAIAVFSGSATTFSEAVQHKFAPAAGEQQESTERLSTSFLRLEKSAQGLADSEAVVHGLVTLQTRLSEDLGAAQQTLRAAVERMAETAASLGQSYTGELLPSHRALHQAAVSFTESAKQLRTFIEQGVDPTTQRLVQLDHTLSRLGDTVESIREFAGVRQDIEHLSAALAQAAQVADALAALPEQVRQVFVDVARAQQEQAAANSRGSLTAWFRGRQRS
jgi:hypothetical protein